MTNGAFLSNFIKRCADTILGPNLKRKIQGFYVLKL